MLQIRNAMLAVGFAIGIPIALFAIGIAKCYVNGEALPMREPLSHLYGPAVFASLLIFGGLALGLLKRLFPAKPFELPKHDHVAKILGRPAESRQPYQTRLARFLRATPAEMNSDPPTARSSMPYWTSVTAFMKHGPKPTSLIRRFLRRIHEAVHGQ